MQRARKPEIRVFCVTKRLRLTNDADRDLIDIYLYGIENFGLAKADIYIQSLKMKLEIIAENPSFGADYNDIKSQLRRYESRSHAIYYQPGIDGVLVLRILHCRMDPARHL